MGRVSTDLDYLYLTICKDLLHAPRVGNTRELNNVKLVLKDITKNVVSVRGISPSYLFGEMIWYFTGLGSTWFISQFSKFWEKISDDGITANSAYGYLMQNAFGFNQIEKVIEILSKDPDSRRAKINLNTPHRKVDSTKDEPCTMFLQFMIRNGKLHCTAVMRSNDIWFGFPYDVAFFIELQKYIADRLGVAYGEYTHFVCSLHMYDKDAEKIAAIVENPVSVPVTYNRDNFHQWCEQIAHVIMAMRERNDVNIREYLMKLLDTFDIYKEEV